MSAFLKPSWRRIAGPQRRLTGAHGDGATRPHPEHGTSKNKAPGQTTLVFQQCVPPSTGVIERVCARVLSFRGHRCRSDSTRLHEGRMEKGSESVEERGPVVLGAEGQGPAGKKEGSHPAPPRPVLKAARQMRWVGRRWAGLGLLFPG